MRFNWRDLLLFSAKGVTGSMAYDTMLATGIYQFIFIQF